MLCLLSLLFALLLLLTIITVRCITVIDTELSRVLLLLSLLTLNCYWYYEEADRKWREEAEALELPSNNSNTNNRLGAHKVINKKRGELWAKAHLAVVIMNNNDNN